MTQRPKGGASAVLGSAPSAAKDERRCYYLINEDQSADLAEFRCALLGLAAIAGNTDGREDADVTVDRLQLNAVFAQLEKRLGDIVPTYRLGTVWLDGEGRNVAFARARSLEPDAMPPRL